MSAGIFILVRCDKMMVYRSYGYHDFMRNDK